MRNALRVAACSLFFNFASAGISIAQHIEIGEPQLAPFGFTAFCVERPIKCAPSHPTTLTITPSKWKELAAINTAVNRLIVPNEDSSTTRPWRDDARQGDCKDYALTKRSRLIDRGWPSSALLIATGSVPSGEMHAVLIVVSTDGDLVLDNLRYGIVPWRILPYRWHSIMSPENPQFWRRIISWLRVHPGAILIITWITIKKTSCQRPQLNDRVFGEGIRRGSHRIPRCLKRIELESTGFLASRTSGRYRPTPTLFRRCV